ncbi:amino acid transporter [Rhodococcus fascians]|uniref:APC family permease n=1 Tax=Nocardiaceae TaxID=85025 RepID=UPI001DC1044A|nr:MULTISPECIES: APC family permease [Rhodococcus]MDR6908411.1 amino acid transporter [Rhodococcus sp. 3258]MDR6930772.1 amino acid transporter [Rhodococcus fascians]CAH0250296.1 Putrescine importer PuuP [Rhodococcus fascians]
MSDTRDGKLKGSIGVVGIVFLVIAAAAPLTAIGGALPIMIATGNGAGAPMAYIVAAVVLLVFSVGYAAMSSHMTDTGAFYAYVGKGLGENVGLGAAGLALLTYTAIQAGIYGLAASTLQGLVVSYGGPDLPWWLWALVLIGTVSVLGYRSIDLGAKVLGVLLVLEIGIVLALSVAVFAQGGADGIDVQSFTPDAFLSGSPGIALMFAIASFIGFEATAIYGEEAKDPKRTVPIATYAAVIVIGAVYAVSSWAVVLAFGSNSVADAAAADPAGLTFAAAAQFLGATWSDIIQIMLVTSLFAALLAFHNAISRYVFALARRGAAPKALARTHARHGSPHVGSIFQTLSAVLVVGVFALAGADPILQLFTWMSGLATVSILVLMVLTGVAIYTFFARTRVDSRTWHTKIAPVLGTLGLLVVLGLVLDNFTLLIGGSSTIAAILLLIVVGFFVAGLLRGISTRRSRSTEASRAIEHEPGELAQ